MDHMYLLHYRVYGNDRFLPSWSERAIELGNPRVMDNATLIEWIERQLETEAETIRRHSLLHETHLQWHQSHPGIYTCCISGGMKRGSYPANLLRTIGVKVGDHELPNGMKVETWRAPDGKLWDVLAEIPDTTSETRAYLDDRYNTKWRTS